jgi:hypothetical protein
MKIQPDTYLIACGLTPMLKKYEMFGWKTDPATGKQKETLSKYGIAYSRVKYKGQASLLIQTILKRNNDGLASPKQIQVLISHGYSMGRIKYLTMRGANKIISNYSIIGK